MNVFDRSVWLRIGLLAAMLLAAIRPAPLAAAAPVASLDVVPADAAFYAALLRNREKYDAIVDSKAFAKLRDLPYVQMGLGLYAMQAANTDSILGKITLAMNNPDSRKQLEFLADIVSDEVFVYGGENFNKTLLLCQGTYGFVYGSAFNAGMQQAAHPGQQRSPAETEEEQGKAFVQALVNQMDLIAFPDLVIGFKVKDKAMAEKFLSRLEPGLKHAFSLAPEFEGRFKRQEIAGHSYLTLALDGGMVPWDDDVVEKIRSLAPTPADGDKLIEHLKKTKLTISLGLRDEFLLLAIGPSTDVLKQLGGAATMRTRPELAAVAKFADKRISMVSYSSKALNERLGYTKNDINQTAAGLKHQISSLPGPAKLHDDLEKSVDELAEDLQSQVALIGATSSIAFFTSSGTEKYAYDWSEHPELDCSQPLSLLKHIGGSPIVAAVGRGKVSVSDYDMLVKWIRKTYGYFEEYAPQQMQPKEREQFHDVMGQIKPLLARFNGATRDLLLPALADGQTALVIDAKLTSRQYIKTLPPTEKPLPMIEPAVVVSVSDAAKLKRAFSQYYGIADDFVDVLKGIQEKEGQHDIPKDFKLPRPKAFHLREGLGTIYGYALPAEAGIDSRIMPNAGLSEHVAVLSMTRGQTQRLLTEKEPVMAGIKLPTTGNYGTVVALDFAALIDAVNPWVEMAFDEAAKHGSQDLEMVRLHTKTVLDVLKCYRGSVAETFREGDATVTRTRSEYHDIDE